MWTVLDRAKASFDAEAQWKKIRIAFADLKHESAVWTGKDLVKSIRGAESFDDWLGIDADLAGEGTNGGEQVQTRREVLEVVLLKCDQLADAEFSPLRNHLDGEPGLLTGGFEFGADLHADRFAGSLPNTEHISSQDLSES